MKEEREIAQMRKPQNAKLKMTFAILFLAVLFIVELYLMMNYPKEYIFLGIAALGILCLVYIVTDLSFKIRQAREKSYEKEYESIYKAQKVSYVFMKQSFMDMEEILERIKANSEVPADELIEAQKAVGKITIKKNRENAASVLNSNEKVISLITSFEENMKDIMRSMEESTGNRNPEISGGQQDIIENFEKNQAVLREEINKLKEQIDLRNREILDAVKISVSESATMLEERISSEISVQVKENSVSEEMISEKLKEIVVEGEKVISEQNIKSDTAVSEKTITAEENTELEPEIPEEQITAEETEMIVEPITAEGPEMPEEPITVEETEISEPEIMEEPAEKETLEEIVSSGKIMTPEEIASLLEETDTEIETQESVKEEEVITSDSSDFGHVMTPEEIAALLANM